MSDPLMTGLCAWYECDEASGNLVDASGLAGNMTAVNSPGATTGKVSGARTFTRTSKQKFTLTSNSYVALGGGDFTIAYWVYMRELGLRYQVCKFNGATAGEYATFETFDGSNWVIGGRVYDSNSELKTSYAGPITTSTWYCFIFRHVASTKTIDTSLNGGAFGNSQTYSGTLTTHSGTLEVGQVGNANDDEFYHDGYMDNIVLASRAWDTTDRDSFYNSGSGRGYAAGGSSFKPAWARNSNILIPTGGLC